jgi:Z1 domain
MFKLSEALTSPAIEELRYAIVTFITGGCIRLIQDVNGGKLPKKFSFIVHTERSREAHAWQEEVVGTVVGDLQEASKTNPELVEKLVESSYEDLLRSLRLLPNPVPDLSTTLAHVISQLPNVMITRVNSEKDIKELLDDSGQLYLRTPLNIFIGGQILDRGLTISNMIGFYYGRTANRFQQDTVLQHSRMYGPRPIDDLAVTRFYTTAGIYSVMNTIHDFDAALREAFEKGGQDAGVVFLRKDDANRIVPCSPNKILLSATTTLRPRKRLLPIGFQTGHANDVRRVVRKIDGIVDQLEGAKPSDKPFLIDADVAKAIVDLIGQTFEFDEEEAGWDINAFKAAIDYLSRSIPANSNAGKLWCLIRRDRDITRMRTKGRFQNSPDTKQEQDAIDKLDPSTPVLMLLKQNGKETNGWRDSPFWWPVLQVPLNAQTVVFTSELVDEP